MGAMQGTRFLIFLPKSDLLFSVQFTDADDFSCSAKWNVTDSLWVSKILLAFFQKVYYTKQVHAGVMEW